MLGKVGLSIHQQIFLYSGALEYSKKLCKVNQFFCSSVIINLDFAKTMIRNDYGAKYYQEISHI